MPRPSIKAQRSEEILNAFERCVALFGVEGATLERTAEEAGLQRSLIRHNLGNRDDLLDALVDRFLLQSKRDLNKFTSVAIDVGDAHQFIEILFDESYSNSQSVLVAEALIMAAPQYPHIAPRLQKWVNDISAAFTKILQHSIPTAQITDCKQVAAGIVGIYFNVESLTPLGSMSALRKHSKQAAVRLVNTLTNQ